MKRHHKAFALALVLAANPISGWAQEVYVGALYEQNDPAVSGFSSFDAGETIVGMAGVRVPVTPMFYIAGEAELPLWSQDADSSSLTSISDAQARYRALIGANLANLSVFIGTGSNEGGGSSSSSDVNLALNIGVDVAVNDAFTVRVEAIQGFENLDSETPSFDGGSVRVGTFINF